MFTTLRTTLRTLPSSSSTSLILQSTRSFSSTPTSPAISTSNRPKRDPTTYGIPSDVHKDQRPLQKDTNTDAHPLWRFFHKKESLEEPDKRTDNSGRSWSSFELRRKSFEELHELWYVCLQERNVLLTQREEARRLRVDLRGFTSHGDKLRMIQKSMARTKQVLSERRHAALEAAAILRARGEDEAADRIANEGKAFADETLLCFTYQREREKKRIEYNSYYLVVLPTGLAESSLPLHIRTPHSTLVARTVGLPMSTNWDDLDSSDLFVSLWRVLKRQSTNTGHPRRQPSSPSSPSTSSQSSSSTSITEGDLTTYCLSPQFDWSKNSAGLNPCQLARLHLDVCNDLSAYYPLPPLDTHTNTGEGWKDHYPDVGKYQASACSCSG
ncbi:large subunit ribosomal protein L47, partial [Phenoliferia sp. Uapishka_3]